MKNVSDRYDFKQPSLSGKFGFETFRKPDDKLYYFHFNDTDGKALLFSQGYRDSKSRDRGIKSVVENASSADRYLKHESEEGQSFFILKAKNNHEIARSREFESRKEMLAMLELLSTIDGTTQEQYIKEVKLPAKSKHSKTPAKPLSKTTQKKAVAEDMPRFRFTLTYYPDSEVWNLKNNFSDDKPITLKELDGHTITEYIQSQMPEKVAVAKHKGKTAQKSSDLPLQSNMIRALMLKTTDGKIKNRLVSKNKFSEVVMDLAVNKLKGKKAIRYDAKVFAESIRDRKKMLIGELIDRIPKEGQIKIPVISEFLKKGIYRLTAELSLRDDNNQLDASGSSQIIMIS